MKATPPMDLSVKSRFLFRGNAVAAGGFLTRQAGKLLALNPEIVTTHGESCLPAVGGVSHAVVKKPALAFPKHIRYGRCETFAYGHHDDARAITTLRAQVEAIRLTTSPSPSDRVPGVQSISFEAARLTIAVESTCAPTGETDFKISPEGAKMALILSDFSGKETCLPITLVFDECRLNFSLPKKPGALEISSFVKEMRVGNEVIAGHVLTRKGFGTIHFGLAISSPSSRRLIMAHILMGSDPGGNMDFAAVEDTGDWGN